MTDGAGSARQRRQLQVGRRSRVVPALQRPVDADLQQLRERRAPAHRVRRPRVVRDDERGVVLPGEVDDQIGALAGRDQQRRHRHGRAQQPALGPDLRERQRPAAVLVGELEVVEPRLGAVDDPEPIAARLDVHERPDLRVHDRDVAEELRHPLRVVVGHALGRVEHAPVRVERLVLQHERDLVRPGGQPERIVALTRVLVVADEVEPCEPRVDVRAGVAERVVVIPDHAGALLVVVGERVGDVVRALLATVREPLQRRPVELRMILAAVQVRDDRHRLPGHHGPHDRRIVGQERVAELVAPLDRHRRLHGVVGPPGRLDRRPQIRQARLRVVRPVAPRPRRRQVRVELPRRRLPRRDREALAPAPAVEHRRHRQRLSPLAQPRRRAHDDGRARPSQTTRDQPPGPAPPIAPRLRSCRLVNMIPPIPPGAAIRGPTSPNARLTGRSNRCREDSLGP